MKRILFTAVLLMGLTVSVHAQDTFKPVAGMSALEITFNPAAVFNSSNGGSSFALPSTFNGLNQGIKYRNYWDENTVTRGTFLLGFQNESVATVLENSSGESVDATNTYFEWALQFKPGIEQHFAGTKRLSPYVGGELILGFGSNKYTEQALNADDAIEEGSIKNGNQDFGGNAVYWNYINGFSIGAGLLAGFDYYIAQNLYLGVEINYAFIYNKANKVVREVPGAEAVETKTGSNWYFNPSTGASLRLGWAF